MPKVALFGQAASYIEANQIIAKNGKYLSQIIAKNGKYLSQIITKIGIKTSCPLYRKQIKNLSQINFGN